MNKRLFEDYLRSEHAKIYTGTDDAMPDAFEGWLTELDIDELIALGDRAMKQLEELAADALSHR